MRTSESYKDYPVLLKSSPELIVCTWDLSAVWIRGDKYTAEEYAKKHGGRFWESTPEGNFLHFRKDPEDLKLYAAGGNRRGMIYALAPAYNTTRYCLRFYLEREDRKHD